VKSTAFERSSKRRKGYPSETKVKRGTRVVHGEKELVEKLGRNDLCPCGSGRRFQTLLPPHRQIRWHQSRLLFSGSSARSQEIKLDFRFLFAYSAGR
jgi:SEC-C motif